MDTAEIGEVREVPLPLRFADGTSLHARRFVPDGEFRGVAVIVPAMATPASFYRRFARWLARQGLITTTFDYRGYGDSATGHLRDVDADCLRWFADAAAILEFAGAGHADLPLNWVGHSLGGQMLGFVDHSAIDRALLITAGSGYWRHYQPLQRKMAPIGWRVVVPMSIAMTGYFPGRRLRLVGDVPPEVARQWRTWCLHPDYLFGVVPGAREAAAEVALPVRALSFTDDELLSKDSMRALVEAYPASDVDWTHYSPEQLGRRRIGHHGFFRDSAEPLWDELVLPALARTPSGLS